MAVTTSAEILERLQQSRTDATSLSQMGVSAVFTLGFFVFLTCVFVSLVILLSVFSPSIHFTLQDQHWQALLRCVS